MVHIPLEEIERVVQNPYEAVVIASREARRINLARKAASAEGEVREDETEKIAVEALKRLTSGRLKYRYRSDEQLPLDEE